jgi:ATP synthase protein I
VWDGAEWRCRGNVLVGEEVEDVDGGRELYPLTAIVRILLAQMGIGLVVAGAGFGISGGVAAWSALLGSLVCVLPNTFLGVRIVLAGGGGDARKLLRASYVGAAGKLLLTAALFAVVFALVRTLDPGWFFGGFMLSQLVIWASPILLRGTETSTGKEIPRSSMTG